MKILQNKNSDICGTKMFIESESLREQVLLRLETLGFNVDRVRKGDQFIYISDKLQIYSDDNYTTFLTTFCEEVDYNSILEYTKIIVESEYVTIRRVQNNLSTPKYQIVALKDFTIYGINVKAGEVGGYITGFSIIRGKSWICDGQFVFNSVLRNSCLSCGNISQSSIEESYIGGQSIIDSVIVTRSTIMYSSINKGIIRFCDIEGISISNLSIKNLPKVTCDNTIIFKNFWSSGRYFLYYIPTKTWQVGCFTGTSEELLEKAKKDGEYKYKMYKKYVDFVKTI